jgi:hypothetical protein
MNLRRVLVRTLLTVLTVAALALAWENRESEKVWTAVVAPAVLLIGYFLSRSFLPGAERWVTAWLGALVAIVGVIFFTTPFHHTRVMTAVFLMRTADGQPVFLPRALMPSQLPVLMAMQNAPPKIWTAAHDRSGRIYHHLLQRAILEALLMSEMMWGAEGDRFASLAGRFQVRKGATIPFERIVQEFAGNLFIAAPFRHTPKGGLTVPPSTTISGKVPDESGMLGHIRLRSHLYGLPFSELTIETMFSYWRLGLHGRYALITTGQDEGPRIFASVNYTVRVTASGSRFFPHHPEMPKYTAWMQAVADGLARIFDDEERWRGLMENQTVRHVILGNQRLR